MSPFSEEALKKRQKLKDRLDTKRNTKNVIEKHYRDTAKIRKDLAEKRRIQSLIKHFQRLEKLHELQDLARVTKEKQAEYDSCKDQLVKLKRNKVGKSSENNAFTDFISFQGNFGGQFKRCQKNRKQNFRTNSG